MVVAGIRFAAAAAEVSTPDADADVDGGDVGVVRLDPVPELASMLPPVEVEHPATVTSDSSAAAAVPAPRLIAHLQCVAVGRRYAASLWSWFGTVAPVRTRRGEGFSSDPRQVHAGVDALRVPPSEEGVLGRYQDPHESHLRSSQQDSPGR